jgi:hypothetical protein
VICGFIFRFSLCKAEFFKLHAEFRECSVFLPPSDQVDSEQMILLQEIETRAATGWLLGRGEGVRKRQAKQQIDRAKLLSAKAW